MISGVISGKMWVINFKECDKLELISKELGKLLEKDYQYSGTLILEEILTNVKKYAYKEIDKNQKLLIFYIPSEHPTLYFLDYGIPFDPTMFIPEEIYKNQIGGHGLRIVKNYASFMEYKRTQEGANVLKIVL